MTGKSKAQQRADQAADEMRAKFNEATELLNKGQPTKALEAWRAVLDLVEAFPDHVLRDNDTWFRTVKTDATYNIACMHAVLGDREQALDTLEKAFGLGCKNREVLEKDAGVEFASVRDDPRFMAVARALEVRDGPLTIENVIRSSIVQKTLTEEGVDPAIDEKIRSCVVYHHEWVRSPELKGIACLMLASIPDGEKGTMVLHDIEGRALFPASKIDRTKLQFIGT